MKKTYQLENLDCANCAAKMERAIRKIDGVHSASIHFLTQKLILEADETNLENILKESIKVCKKVDSDCSIII